VTNTRVESASYCADWCWSWWYGEYCCWYMSYTNSYGDVSVLHNNGDGTFGATSTIQTAYDGGVNRSLASAVAIGDLNGDGRPDLVVTNDGDANATVLLNRGDMNFSQAMKVGTGATPVSVAVADLDGNGSLDLVVANAGSGTLSVLLNGCQAIPSCDDGNPCTADSWDADAQACMHTNLDGTACDDGNLCTTGDTCWSGSCQGNAVTCSDACNDGTCDPSTGGCLRMPKPDGTACDLDQDLCTPDACQAGTCVAGARTACAALDSCHAAGTCDPGTGGARPSSRWTTARRATTGIPARPATPARRASARARRPWTRRRATTGWTAPAARRAPWGPARAPWPSGTA